MGDHLPIRKPFLRCDVAHRTDQLKRSKEKLYSLRSSKMAEAADSPRYIFRSQTGVARFGAHEYRERHASTAHRPGGLASRHYVLQVEAVRNGCNGKW
ncbi:Protein of unknown function [Gryllus bimaculatus]|nr:Protein of unknown function [Gryllus bimaculatus]